MQGAGGGGGAVVILGLSCVPSRLNRWVSADMAAGCSWGSKRKGKQVEARKNHEGWTGFTGIVETQGFQKVLFLALWPQRAQKEWHCGGREHTWLLDLVF